jgi:hypothetical protein
LRYEKGRRKVKNTIRNKLKKTEILLKVVLNTIKQTNKPNCKRWSWIPLAG